MANKLEKFIIGPGVFVYPKISRPDTYGEYADNKFKTGFVVDADNESAQKCVKAINALVKANGLKVVKSGQNRTVPFDDEHEEHEGKILFSAKTKDKPLIVDAKNKKLGEGVLVGGGSVGYIQVAVNVWSKKVKNETKPKGINLYLNSAQIVELTAYSSRETSPFEEQEGFEADESGSSFEEHEESEERDTDEAAAF